MVNCSHPSEVFVAITKNRCCLHNCKKVLQNMSPSKVVFAKAFLKSEIGDCG